MPIPNLGIHLCTHPWDPTLGPNLGTLSRLRPFYGIRPLDTTCRHNLLTEQLDLCIQPRCPTLVSNLGPDIQTCPVDPTSGLNHWTQPWKPMLVDLGTKPWDPALGPNLRTQSWDPIFSCNHGTQPLNPSLDHLYPS